MKLYPEEGWTQMDPDHLYQLVGQANEDGPIGIIEAHRLSGDEWCYGGVFWKQVGTPEHPRPVWTLVSLEPLHLEPSILCQICGNHGFIRGGRWVSA